MSRQDSPVGESKLVDAINDIGPQELELCQSSRAETIQVEAAATCMQRRAQVHSMKVMTKASLNFMAPGETELSLG